MRTLIKLGLVFALLFGITPFAMADSTQAAATEFVQRQHLGNSLRTLALSAAQRTQTFAIMASKLGPSEAQMLVSNELDAYSGQFEKQWNINLAKIYARHFTSEELASLASEGRNSRYASKWTSMQEIVGTEMQRQSTPILAEYVSTSLNSAFAKFSTR